MPEANPVLMEPIGELKVTIPDSYMGDVIGDLNKRRGRIMGMNPTKDGEQVVEAEVPMAEMSTYAIDLRAMTQSQGPGGRINHPGHPFPAGSGCLLRAVRVRRAAPARRFCAANSQRSGEFSRGGSTPPRVFSPRVPAMELHGGLDCPPAAQQKAIEEAKALAEE